MFDSIMGVFGGIGSWIKNFVSGFATIKDSFSQASGMSGKIFPFIPDEIMILIVVGITLVIAITIVKMIIDLL